MDPYRVDSEKIHHLAALASLEFSPEEEKHFAEELNRILSHIRVLQKVNTEKIEAAFQTFPSTNVTRDDTVEPSLSLEQVLQNAPDRERVFFKMPPILERDP